MVGAIWLKKIGIFFCSSFGVDSDKIIIEAFIYIYIYKSDCILIPLFKKLDKFVFFC